ncbi:MAG: preprotein translocase subunit SecG [Lachnospiraceae bacterium]|nr:preprotein translocase subunit SecG [Lachnospiraceae bacterium]
MEVLRIVLMVVYIIASIALAVVILMQEGKSQGLGAISGAADTYWGKIKGRSLEGKLELVTKILAVFFVVAALILNMQSFG